VSSWFGTFSMLLEDGWYIVVNAYKVTVTIFENWRDFFCIIIIYIVCPCYPYTWSLPTL